MVLRIPGHRIARTGDRASGGGGNDFVELERKRREAKWWGPASP